MKKSDQYHKWVEWSAEDQTYIGKCPDVITGIHGEDPVAVARCAPLAVRLLTMGMTVVILYI